MSYLRNHCQVQCHEDFLLYFSSRSFTVLGPMSKALIHFDLILVYGARKGSNFIVLYISRFPSIISPLSSLGTLVKYHLVIYVRIISGLCTLFHWSNCLCRYHTVWLFYLYNLFLKPGSPPSLFFYSKIVLAVQGLLGYHMSFRMNFSISLRICHWDFVRDYVS